MSSKFLYFGFEPPFICEKTKTMNDCFREEFKKADGVEMSVGYCGHDSLKALEKLVDEGNIKHICLTLGMYFNDGGFLPGVYKLIVDLNEKGIRKGIGEIRLIHDGKNHEKLYCFAKDNVVFSTIVSSSNFIFLASPPPEGPIQREVGYLVTDPIMLKCYKEYLEGLKSSEISANITILEKYKKKIYRAGKVFKIKYEKP